MQVGPEFRDDIVDLEMEIWPTSTTNYVKILKEDKSAVDLGAIGYTGLAGMYIPNYMVSKYPKLGFERQLCYPASGTGPRILNDDGSPVCDGSKGTCLNGTFIAPHCNTTKSKCVELWGYDVSNSPRMFQKIIRGLSLPLTINYLGSKKAEETIRKAMDAKQNILFYNWAPSRFVASTPVTRVLFPPTNISEYATLNITYVGGVTNTSTLTPVTSDFPAEIIHKLASQAFLEDFPELQNSLNNMSYAQAACKWVNENCPRGQGRYLINGFYSCMDCPSDTFNWRANNTGHCEICPWELYCPGRDVVNVTKGYWMSPTPNPLADEPEFYLCPFEKTCCHKEACPVEDSCGHGFTGLLCTECSEPNHYLWNEECVPSPTVEILFFYFQVTEFIFKDSIGSLDSLPGLGTFLAITSLNVDGMVSDCPLPLSGLSKLGFRYFLPVMILVFIVLIYLVLRVSQAKGLSLSSFFDSMLPLICFRAIIVVLMFIVMPLIDTSLHFLQCTNFQGKTVLKTVPQIECFSQRHIGSAILAIFILTILLVLLPLAIAFVLLKLQKVERIKYQKEDLSPAEKLFQCLYIVFKPDMYYMLPITIIEKGVTSILFTLMEKFDEAIKINVFLIFLAFLCATRIYWQPYNNHLEAFLNREICLGILVMVGFRTYMNAFETTQAIVIQIGIVAVLPAILHMIRWILWNYRKHEEVIKAVTSNMMTSSGHKSKLSKAGSANDVTQASIPKKSTRMSMQDIHASLQSAQPVESAQVQQGLDVRSRPVSRQPSAKTGGSSPHAMRKSSIN
ncbi:hypothetical protein BDR26DRAFT_870623 [Obelidium mucronatum]|nr:hypothetical protein BDR26DRAFT_870623 [Obelidium mucronatum]